MLKFESLRQFVVLWETVLAFFNTKAGGRNAGACINLLRNYAN